ncbi:MFS transporter [Novosphingobium sp. Rr 2-17]|uniref:MFS transporter n=1 Tax=Novosphingobium sp. Rr 2-17 TaxID=555793 RepID=UPI0002ED0F6E|nr:MFS transporter [Novosphingobium sp. Rr 2-17]
MGLIVLVPVLPQMMVEFREVAGFEYLVPLMLTLPALCVAVLSPFAGLVVDKLGRRRTLIWALIVYAIFGMAPMILSDLKIIIATRVVVGAMEAVIVTASTTLIGDYFDGKTREKWLANQTAFASLSSVVLSLLGGLLGNFGWRAPFAAYGVSLLYVVGLLLWTWEPQKSAVLGRTSACPAKAFPWIASLPVALIAIFGGIMFFTMQIQVSNVLADSYGIRSASDLGLFAAIAGFSVALGTVIYRLLGRLRFAIQIAIAFGLLGISYVMINHAPQTHEFTFWLIANQLGAGILLPALVVFAMAQLPFERRGRGTGIFMMGWWLGQPLSTQIAAVLKGWQGGNLTLALQTLGIVCLVASFVALLSMLRGRINPAVSLDRSLH